MLTKKINKIFYNSLSNCAPNKLIDKKIKIINKSIIFQNKKIYSFKNKLYVISIGKASQSLLNGFLNLNVWDEARVFIGPGDLKKGLQAPSLESFGSPFSKDMLGLDKLICYRR